MKKILLLTSVWIAALAVCLLLFIRGGSHSVAERVEEVDVDKLSPELALFISEYEQVGLPVGTLVKVEGSFELLSIPKGADPDSKAVAHHTGDYVCVFPVGVVDKIYYRSSNFSVPRDMGGGIREMSYYDVEVFSNGQEVLELNRGVKDHGGTYRKTHEATLRKHRSWLTVDFATGRVFFPLNVSFNRQALSEIAYENAYSFEVESSEAERILRASTSNSNIFLEMDPTFALRESTYFSQYGTNRNGTQIVYSDMRSLAYEDRLIYIPYRAEFYTLSDDERIYSSVNEVHAITILDKEGATETFEEVIPHGWWVSNEIEDAEYQQGEPVFRRVLNKVLDRF
ncbi:hypothetical protein P3T73_07235 [Kiritimatiellota bacterium B12222]|nr:hypothetical protein P3T73_07235 [Kiritimatiellota bacterium B12222]